MIVNWIEKMFKHSFEKKWYETYWAFDVHGVILKPNHRKNSIYVEFYPHAKEALQLISKRNDIVMILSTSSYPEEIKHYMKVFEENDIHFKYVNENPEINSKKGNFGHYDQKFYFNVLFEDKAGYSPETEWKLVKELFIVYEVHKHFPNKKWSTKY